ncbi:MAG TPA: hypothetical protein VJN02_00055 [Gammaproteobacteria bacterium]|nr:hypothetical protein [Gammaproteobacteria bacterium]
MSKAYRKVRHVGRGRHHNLAKSRNGGYNIQNLILLDNEKHQLLHKIFGNRTLREIIAVLKRLDRAKQSQCKGGRNENSSTGFSLNDDTGLQLLDVSSKR